MDKAIIRKNVSIKLNTFSESYLKELNEKIYKNLGELKEYKNSRVIFSYVSKENEPDTTKIINDILESNKVLAVPKCVNESDIKAYQIKSIEELEIGLFNILEPKNFCIEIIKNNIDFAIIPCLTCDKFGNRIGYGKGYFDRFLYNAKFTTAVLCREKLMFENIEKEINDVPIDIVITENNIYRKR